MSAIELLLGQPAAQAVGWALLHFVWQGVLIGVLTAGALALLRHSAADVRYVVSAIGLSLMFTMPVVTAVQTWNTVTAGRPDGSAVLVHAVAPSSSSAPVVAGDAPIASSFAASADGVSEDVPAGVALVERIRLEPWLPVMVLGWLC